MNFAALQGLTIPEGVVTQIADASGRVLWKLETSKPVVLEVARITSDTYAGETTYTGEQFILLDIYPKTNGTVKVTYGGLTKTITDTSGVEEPNAQKVFFGTFNGVSDSVATPASGELTIEGNYYAFGCGHFKESSAQKTDAAVCKCITAVTDMGAVTQIPADAFYNCFKATVKNVPSSIVLHVPEGVTKIGTYAFRATFESSVSNIQIIESTTGLKEIVLPSSILSIGSSAFEAYMPSSGMVEEASKSNVLNFKILATTPPTIIAADYNNIFGDYYGDGSIIVPKGCGEAYKAAAGWSIYADYIVEAS